MKFQTTILSQTTSNIFEKLILKRILEIQEDSKVDITGVEHCGFKAQKVQQVLQL